MDMTQQPHIRKVPGSLIGTVQAIRIADALAPAVA